jgi:hypothetical protein
MPSPTEDAEEVRELDSTVGGLSKFVHFLHDQEQALSNSLLTSVHIASGKHRISLPQPWKSPAIRCKLTGGAAEPTINQQ